MASPTAAAASAARGIALQQQPLPRSQQLLSFEAIQQQQQQQQQQVSNRGALPGADPHAHGHGDGRRPWGDARASGWARAGAGGGSGSGGGGGGEAGDGVPRGEDEDGSGPGESGEGSELLQELLACRDCRSLHRFLTLHRPRLGHKRIISLAVHLSHLVAEEPPEGDYEAQLAAAMAVEAAERLRGPAAARALGGHELAAAACALSKLRCYDGPLLREMAAAAREAAGQLTSRQAAGLVWAYARYHDQFRFPVEPGWAATLLEGQLPNLPAARPAELAMLLYGCALLRQPPPQHVLPPLLDAFIAGLPDCDGRELAMAVWALATLRLDPGPRWMGAFLSRCEAATRTFADGTAVANVVWALATLGCRPPPGWMHHFMWQAQRRMVAMDGQALCMLAWALARLRYRPDNQWWGRFLRYSRQQLLQAAQAEAQEQAQEREQAGARAGQWRGGARLGLGARRRLRGAGSVTPQAFNNLAWAFARLSMRPQEPWLLLYCRTVQPRLWAFPPSEQAMLLWALARLDFRPPAGWMLDFGVAVSGALPRYGPADCVMVLQALGGLCSAMGYRAADLDADVHEGLARRLEPHLPQLQNSTLVSVLLAACRVKPPLPSARIAAMLAAMLARVQSIQQQQFLKQLQQRRQEEAQEQAYGHERLASSDEYSGQGGWSSIAPQSGAAMQPAAPALTPRECSNAVFAVGCALRRVGRHPGVRDGGRELLRLLLPAADRAMGAMNGVDLLQVLQGVAAARVRCSPDWLRRHEVAVRQRLDGGGGGLTAAHLVQLHAAYGALGYRAGLLPALAAQAASPAEEADGEGS